ncbi:hypothetical protein FBU59_006620 [Linderina macrospora]|uniref:Uncharacterized protein n=1 Tax=Linderina macrospora TaxID=4868 RepID=A0ACC1IZC5_9FUNG|nr:hypothetical protein FBU59_006620 [Linderina macrospora]
MAVRPITNRDETSILVCAPESPVPLVTVRQRGVVAAVALVPAASSGKSGRSHPDTEHGQLKPDPLAHNSLAILTAAGRLNVYAAESDTLAFKHTKDTPLGSEKAGAAARTMDSKVFSSIFGKSKPRTSSADSLDASAATNPHVRNAMRLVRSAVHSAYVNAPHHVLPPVSALFDQFVTQQLAKVSIRDTEEKREEESRDAEMVGEEGGEENGGDAEGPRATTKAPFLKSLRRGFQASQ